MVHASVKKIMAIVKKNKTGKKKVQGINNFSNRANDHIPCAVRGSSIDSRNSNLSICKIVSVIG